MGVLGKALTGRVIRISSEPQKEPPEEQHSAKLAGG